MEGRSTRGRPLPPAAGRGPLLRFTLYAAISLPILWGVGRLLGSGVIDDTYIFLHYARNLAQGRGLRFNPAGVPVEGYTSTVWVFLLAPFYRLGLDPVAAARWLSLLLAAGAIALLVPARPNGRRWDDLALLFLLASFPALAFWAGTGMDLACFLVVTAAIASLLLRTPLAPWRLGVAIGLGSWVRLEAFFLWLPWALLSAVLLQADPRRRWGEVWRIGVAALLLVAPQFLLRWSVFHALLPNTFYAKVSVPLVWRISHGWAYLLESLPAFAAWVAMAGVAAVWGMRRRNRRSLVLTMGALLWTIFVLLSGGDHFALGRFLLPAVLLTALAFRVILDEASRPGSRWALRALMAGVFAGSLVSLSVPGAKSARLEAPLTRAWANVGVWLGEHEPPSTRIAVVVAGAIPYYSGLPTFDLLGLVTAEVARQGKVYAEGRPGHQKYNTDALLAFRPDLIVFQSSGVWPVPRMQDPLLIDKKYAYALYDAFMDPRVRELYVPEATRLPNGTWLEVLRRKS